jgi:hypothetical protein
MRGSAATLKFDQAIAPPRIVPSGLASVWSVLHEPAINTVH